MLQFVYLVVLVGVATAQDANPCQNVKASAQTAGRLYMDGDCTFYYRCVNGRQYKKEPCGIGKKFDPFIGNEEKGCVPDSQPVNCTLSVSYYSYYDGLCNGQGNKNVAMPENKGMYIPCWNNKFQFPPMNCAGKQKFNSKTGNCDLEFGSPNNQIDNNGQFSGYNGGYQPNNRYQGDYLGGLA